MSEWTNELILNFLEVYEAEPVIWNPKNARYKDKTAVSEAWVRISDILMKPVSEIKRKKECLMTTFRFALKKKKESIRRGASAADIYRPRWFAYDTMERFLAQVYECDNICDITRNEVTKPATKKQKRNVDNNFLQTWVASQRNETSDEFDAVGKNVAAKLRQMDFHQRVLSEALIQQVLTKGLFSELTRQTAIEDVGNGAFTSVDSYKDELILQKPIVIPVDDSNSSDPLA